MIYYYYSFRLCSIILFYNNTANGIYILGTIETPGPVTSNFFKMILSVKRLFFQEVLVKTFLSELSGDLNVKLENNVKKFLGPPMRVIPSCVGPENETKKK